jgi:hypothetical protein
MSTPARRIQLTVTLTESRFRRVLREAQRKGQPLHAALGKELARSNRRKSVPIFLALDAL